MLTGTLSIQIKIQIALFGLQKYKQGSWKKYHMNESAIAFKYSLQ